MKEHTIALLENAKEIKNKYVTWKKEEAKRKNIK